MAKELSGLGWVSKFPTSVSLDDLETTFKGHVKKFIAALEAAGASVTINATLRPKQRAYLMHWSFMIAKRNKDPEKVPAMAGVNIEWVHKDTKGNKNIPSSKTAAGIMVDGYDIAYEPALVSRHTEGKAIDMDISWTSKELTIQDAKGKSVTIKSGVKNGGNSDLQSVGKSYGVIKLASDPPHWSSDGH